MSHSAEEEVARNFICLENRMRYSPLRRHVSWSAISNLVLQIMEISKKVVAGQSDG
jgi:hypothetical protein